MPRIADTFTDNAVYIYASKEDAESGKAVGGSGFLVHVPFVKTQNMQQTYVVTNQHVVRQTPTPVIRMNRIDGSVLGLVTNRENWTLHPDGDDVAVMPIPSDPNQVRRMTVGLDRFVTKQLIADEDIGIGDDTVMIGRFIGHDGRQRNTPAVRFGNIAMMAEEKIRTVTGFEQESFLVELRSMPGYSGSAVYIYSTNTIQDMSTKRKGESLTTLSNFNLYGPDAQQHIHLMDLKMAPKGPYLLGIDWCHLNNEARVRDPSGALHPEKLFVRENTGMAGVVPAWKIAEILESESLVNARHELEERLAKKHDEGSQL
jgi:hypothetical protein